ncbi:XdhC/CoxI family protein [Acidithrix sp. C25]|uniref:XdhC family protein n=1 Tax=Acidithrix sp. C25 TaxID=1671482 RepID=UPI00191BB194|nr:XdhC/CoxI family protein [Acidithrix sp. C25]CAG4920254.1 unnamed protein product [Acidithrix sp. C25]
MEQHLIARSIIDENAKSPVALARIISMSGFGGRTSGEFLALGSRLKLGSLMFGSMDREIEEAARHLVATSSKGILKNIDLGDRDAVAAGLACGGSARVALQPINGILLESILAISKRDVVGVVSQIADDSVVTLGMAQLNEKARFDDDFQKTPAHAKTSERLVELVTHRRSVSTTETIEGLELHFEVFSPPSTAAIIGDSELARAIAAQLSLLNITSRITDTVETAMDIISGFGANDALIVLSHDHAIGVPLCAKLLEINGAYVGALGSRHTQSIRNEALIKLGVAPSKVSMIYGPIGLDIGAKTPAETAVAIASEFLAHRSGRAPSSLVNGDGPING